MKCENCGNEHDGSYGSGRFCSKKCSRSFCGKKNHTRPTKDTLNKRIGFGAKRSAFGTWKCDCCGEVFETKKFLYIHKHSENHFIIRRAWNKGLTAETSQLVEKNRNKVLEGYKNGSITPSFLGRHHTDNSKEKIKQAALASPHQRKCKKTIQYTCKDGSIVNLDSSYEYKLACILDEHNIKWSRPLPLKWNDIKGVEHNYFPDFYLIDYDIYLDPKNEFCFNVQKEKILIIKEMYKNCFFLHKNEIEINHIMSLCHKGCGADF